MSKNQNYFLIVILILTVIVSGCTDNQDLSSSVKSMPEVQQFMKEHPDAKISVTYWSKEEVIQSSQKISDDCGKNIIPSAMYKAIISESNERIISWINAENKIVICTTTQGNDNSKITASSTIKVPPASSERNENPNPTIPEYSVSPPTTRQTTGTEISPPPTINDSESTLTPEKTPFESSTPSIIVATPTVSITSVQTPISTVSPSVSGTTLSLKPGWNLISSSITEGIDLSTIEQSCTILQYKKQKLWEWNAQAQSWTNPDYLGPFKGYWIYAADTCNVPLSGTPAFFTTLQLYKGWNKVSAKGSLPAISGTCTGHIVKNWVWNWDKNTEKWTHPITMQLDKGYWINVDQDCTLGGQATQQTQTPILTPSPSPSGPTLSLKPGWNQISSPIASGIDLSTIEQSCTILQYKNQKLYAWDAQAQSWTYPDRIDPLKGYWIYAADTCNVPLSGTPATFTTLQLYNGWNKVSAKGSISSIAGTCSGHIVGNWIWNWDKNKEKWIHPDSMELNKGYWIKVDQDCKFGG